MLTTVPPPYCGAGNAATVASPSSGANATMKYLIAATLSALFMTTLPAQAEDGSERLRQLHAKHLEGK